MHDPMTVAFEIKSPFRTKKLSLSKNAKGADRIRPVIITIWHVDPCTDGTGDSCGWFVRARHGEKEVLDNIRKEFDFNLKNDYWFDKDGKQIFSTIGTLVEMYSHATWIYFNRNRRKQNKFMRKYLYDIIRFSENPIDCGGDNITNKWNCKSHEERFNGMAGMIYSDICRKQQKWWQHPKWHIHHWKIQLVFLRRFKKKNTTKSNIDDNLRATI